MARIHDALIDSDDDEFPDLELLKSRTSEKPTKPLAKAPAKTPLRRRKLGQLTGNAFLRPWGSDEGILSASDRAPLSDDGRKPSRPRVQLRARKQKPTIAIEPVQDEDEDEDEDEDAHAFPDKAIPPVDEISLDDSSEFQDTVEFNPGSDDDDTFDDIILSKPAPRRKPPIEKAKSSPTKPRQPLQRRQLSSTTERKSSRKDTDSLRSETPNIDDSREAAGRKRNERPREKPAKPSEKNTADDGLPTAFSTLRIDDIRLPPAGEEELATDKPSTPPLTPPKPRTTGGLVSPKKMHRIPTTPHHPNTDIFWSKEFVDDWNDEHSPRKQLFPDASKSPAKTSPKKKALAKPASARETKKAFEQAKHEIAAKFLEELDSTITQGKLAELAASTGGIQLNWTNKLNTTAGRASWKRETVRAKPAGGGDAAVTHRHRAAIELAEKVIDDEHRLLNVMAHEFCHLANFMVSGVTANPHGKEFKAWAARCSRAFADRGIQVTTKHSYDIDFKYVWECSGCATEYKRHSKSINQDRHRCGSCKSELRQTKPVPRGPAAPSEYQKFMKEQMKLLKEENPKSPQKDIMKLVAQKWSSRPATTCTGVEVIEDVADGLDALTLGEEK